MILWGTPTQTWSLQRMSCVQNAQLRSAKVLRGAVSSAVILSSQYPNGEGNLRKSHSILAGQQNVLCLAGKLPAHLEARTEAWHRCSEWWLSAVGGRWISPNPSGHIHQPVWDQGGLIPSLVFTQKSTDFIMLYAFLSIRQTKAEGEIQHTITYKMKKLIEQG